jgi:4-aminobutyrate aminotransferase-like enzyme
MAGLELRHPDGAPATQTALGIIKRMLRCGFILLPEGEHGNVVSFTPPLTITESQLDRAIHQLERILNESCPSPGPRPQPTRTRGRRTRTTTR